MAWMAGEYEVSEGISGAVKWLVEEVMEKQRGGRVRICIEGGDVIITEPKEGSKEEKEG